MYLARSALSTVFVSFEKTAHLSLFAHLFGVCGGGVSKTGIFHWSDFDRKSHFAMPAVWRSRVGSRARKGTEKSEVSPTPYDEILLSRGIRA